MCSYISDDLVEKIEAIVGKAGVIRDETMMRSYEADWRNAFQGKAALVIRPATTEQTAAVVRTCYEAGVSLVPQGGNTGLCGGSVPSSTGNQIVLSLNRMNRIREIDPANATITAEAGVILQRLQEAASEANSLFPLSLGAEGSCTIGGNLATNAGGTAVLRYGSMRDLTLGLEVVLPDGRIWNGLRGLRKDNTGYDLKQLFIGAEGTLGVITAAVLKLFPATRSRSTAWVALPSPEAALGLIGIISNLAGDRLTGFEMMSRQSVEFVIRHVDGCAEVFNVIYPWYALIELSDTLGSSGLGEVLESGLVTAFESEIALDAIIANSEAQADALWKLREGISEAQNYEGPSLKHDISVPVSRIPEFIEHADSALQAAFPDIRIVSYGHVGDGNLHYNISKPAGVCDKDFISQSEEITHKIYQLVIEFNGSISAEHGLGQAKVDAAHYFKDKVEMEVMLSLKKAMDPKNILNPGKIFKQ